MGKKRQDTRAVYKSWIAMSMAIVALWCGLIYTIWQVHLNERDTYLDSEMDKFTSKVDSTLKTYEVFSNYIFEDDINTEAVLGIMKKAGAAQGAEKDKLRDELYKYLIEDYREMEKYDFRQLHFQLPDGESFLRFHAPDKYGDNLFEVRDSIRIANVEKRYVYGFEEGKIYNGYRFVYPLNDDGDHVGSVEVSISMSTLINVFYKLYPNMESFFIIDKQVVDKKVFQDKLNNYEESSFSPQYYYDKEVEKFSLQNTNLFVREDLERFIGQLRPHIQPYLSGRESFRIIEHFDGRDYFVGFIAIRNVAGDPVGYVISIYENQQISKIAWHMYTEAILINIICILFLVASLLYRRSSIRLKRISEVDFLTRLYTRQKFMEMAHLEFERYLRHRGIFGIILFDIDHFKRVNDTYGHGAGDRVLQSVGERVQTQLRVNDVAARWGGEEFILMLPETGMSGVVQVAEKIRQSVAEQQFPEIGQITISLGVASLEGETISLEEMIDRADRALYRAKENGRNQVACHEIKQNN